MLVKCEKCRLPETYETIKFDTDGVCNICKQKEFKDASINWNERKKTLDDIIEKYRSKYDYDCIVPFSGGKDSTFTLYYLVKEYKIKPLVIQFNHGFFRPNLIKNNERTFKKLGVDVITFTPNWKVVKRLMLEALIQKGDFCWHCHTGVFSFPMHIAVKFKVPLIFWGEPSSEYTDYYNYKDNKIEEVNEERFNKFVNLGLNAQDMGKLISKDFQFDPRDLAPYAYPDFKDLKDLGYNSVCLGSFIPWDTRKQSQLIMDELGWKGDEVEGMPPENYKYEKIECYFQGMRDYIKYLKRGFSRVSQMVALDIRNGRITKEEADKLVDQYEGKKPPSLQLFLEYLELTEDEFNKIVMNTVVAPHKPDFDNIEAGPKTWDFDMWYRG